MNAVLRWAANLNWLYTELPFLERFAAAAQDGFEGVELLTPYAWPVKDIAARLQAHGLVLALINTPAGGHHAPSMASAWDSGARGTACLPGREAEFEAGLAQALHYAQALRCSQMHVMAGLLGPEDDAAQAQATYVRNLRSAARQAAALNVQLLIEPINPHDMPGYFLNHQAQAHAVVRAVGAPNVHVQLDMYHCQRVEGDVVGALRQHVPTGRVGHVQIAGWPGRHEPDVGQLPYAQALAALHELGYRGWVGCEYQPVRGQAPGATSAGLGWRDNAVSNIQAAASNSISASSKGAGTRTA